ncbi:hypothetical protein JYK14_21090 [Siccirubricoccus sp. KC 17139]|uniref:Uncharacterized protein n=1 Tax=Siccirubricoccus soli TaxID=2899147 RepID=A0ABT1D9L7_9PROT|nr:hypothetical protein [Siccirubricoccus soli]MCO6418631.1 hypothetical protein [Siccirubricoccus soli]MCP2684766.1 hypothetical protein [Siccirubricoccus soli]
MTDAPRSDTRLDRDLIALLDHALTLVADRLTPEQRALLRDQADKMGAGLSGHIERHCSHEVQLALLNRSEAGQLNPDGGVVGHPGDPANPHQKDGSTDAEGSGDVSAIPTA